MAVKKLMFLAGVAGVAEAIVSCNGYHGSQALMYEPVCPICHERALHESQALMYEPVCPICHERALLFLSK
ncbi:hypothetical protein EUGRSUZ_B00220 [Eucalyptus grandis]|uniref:Uncharacterized protein n=2 Tax=Eucalyptus grandis TaxID=71139 RepID=A0ACC3LM40_EUCGR|nr:hypothetical protein EUGRSUZ_B00220 [Eucalyptus grandis]